MPEQFDAYNTDFKKLIPIIYQCGYLTIKDVRRIGFHKAYKLDFANAEAAKGFLTLTNNN